MKGKKTGGRVTGSVNKVTASVKNALQIAFQGQGGIDALTEWARQNPAEFYRLWIKLLPTQAQGESSKAVRPVVNVSLVGSAPKNR